MSAPAFEVDHVFVCVSRGAPEMDLLVEAGFSEGPPNRHPGQGTACRRIFFGNAYLEMAWLEDEVEASARSVERTGLARRMGLSEGASRLGVALRATGSGPQELPVDTWPYRPPYFSEGLTIPVAASSRILREPLLFFMPRGRGGRPPESPRLNDARMVSNITITLPVGERRSAELEWLYGSGCLDVVSGPSEMLEIELDGGRGGRSVDLAPAAPLRLRW